MDLGPAYVLLAIYPLGNGMLKTCGCVAATSSGNSLCSLKPWLRSALDASEGTHHFRFRKKLLELAL